MTEIELFQADARKVREEIGKLRQRLRDRVARDIEDRKVTRHGHTYKVTSVRLNMDCHIEVHGVRVNKAGKVGTREMYIGYLSLCKIRP